MIAYKAISVSDGQYQTLGMNGAPVIILPVGEWIKSVDGPGFSAGKTASNAHQVIRFAQGRRVLPIPPNMTVFRVRGRDKRFENAWRYIFGEILLVEEERDGD